MYSTAFSVFDGGFKTGMTYMSGGRGRKRECVCVGGWMGVYG